MIQKPVTVAASTNLRRKGNAAQNEPHRFDPDSA